MKTNANEIPLDGQGNPIDIGLSYKFGRDQYVVIVKSINDDGSVNAFDVLFEFDVKNIDPSGLFRPKIAPFYDTDVEAIIKFGGRV